MILRSVLLAALLAAVGYTITRALVTGDGVGVLEYVVGAMSLAVLIFGLFELSRRVIRRA
jgi:hypothetical protein